jgi:prolycopene isomerase
MTIVPTQDAYDAVVVGSGIGGLTAAALMSAAGRRVLVCEAQAAPGGYVHSFQRGPYTLDPSVHQIADPAMYSRLLEHLGVREEVTFLEPDDLFSVSLPGLQMHAPLGVEPFIQSFEAALPSEARSIREFWLTAAQVHHDAHELPARAGLRDLDEINALYPALMRYRRATVEAVARELLPDWRARALCAAITFYFSVPASTLSFVTFSQMVFSHVGHGAAYVEGGMQRLVDALVLAIERRGGEVICATAVERIRVDSGRVSGVQLVGHTRVHAPVVVSGADPFQTFGTLLGEEAPVGYLRRMHRLQPAISGFLVFGATGLDLERAGVGHVTFHVDSWDTEDAYRRTLAGDPGLTALWAPTVVDPTLAPAGEHVVLAVAPMGFDAKAPWGEIKAELAPRIWRHLDGLVPGLGESLTFSEPATPLTLARFSGNHQGAQYGWDLSASQKASLRPDIVTPVNGLFMAGHWTALGGGFLRSTLAGMTAAERVLARDGLESPRFVSDMSAVAN